MKESSDAIPFHRVTVSAEARRAVDDVLSSGWLTAGPQTRAFETEFAARVQASSTPGARRRPAGNGGARHWGAVVSS